MPTVELSAGTIHYEDAGIEAELTMRDLAAVERARAFSMLDHPDRLAGLVRDFATSSADGGR